VENLARAYSWHFITLDKDNVFRDLITGYPACADNVCLAHCIYFGDLAEIEQTVLKKRKMRAGSREIVPRAIAFSKNP